VGADTSATEFEAIAFDSIGNIVAVGSTSESAFSPDIVSDQPIWIFIETDGTYRWGKHGGNNVTTVKAVAISPDNDRVVSTLDYYYNDKEIIIVIMSTSDGSLEKALFPWDFEGANNIAGNTISIRSNNFAYIGY
jgi:hypothetical protein